MAGDEKVTSHEQIKMVGKAGYCIILVNTVDDSINEKKQNILNDKNLPL